METLVALPDLNPGHGSLEEIMYGTIKTHLLLTAIKLRVFDALRIPRSAREVATALGTHSGNTLHMLRALTACGLLKYSGGVFQNSPESQAFLDSESPTCISTWLAQAAQTFEPVLENLKDLIADGPGKKDADAHMNSEAMCEFYTHAHAQTELAGVAQRTARLVKALPEYGSFKKMLDVGGGPGLNSVAIVMDHPGLHSVVLDRKRVVDIAREYIERFGMTDRIQTSPGDYCNDDVGNGYDFILVSDTLYYPREQLDGIVSKLFAALNPGGVLMGIHGVLTEDKTAPGNMVIGMLPDALMEQGELPDSGFLAPSLFRAGFASVHTRQVPMVSNPMEVDIARKADGLPGGMS